MTAVLPGIFEGRHEGWTFYQLATHCRLNYSGAQPLYDRIRQAMRTHYTRVSVEGGLGGIPAFPRTTVFQFGTYQLVVVSGSTTLQDWMDNVGNTLMATMANPNGTHCVGVDWWTKSEHCWTAIRDSGLVLDKPAIFSGHSLGGAIARCLSYRWKLANGTAPVVVVTFGCPRVGNLEWNSGCAGSHYRVVNSVDLVTGLPHFGWRWGAPGQPGIFLGYRHGGGLYFLEHFRPRAHFAPGSDDSGLDYHVRLQRGDPRAVLGDQLFAAFASTHRIGAYVSRLRTMVRGANHHALWGFDDVNAGLNTEFNEGWAEDVDLTRGHGNADIILPEDPPVPMPPPPAETAPLDVFPPAVVPIGPNGLPIPPTRRQLELQTIRRRRNIG